MGTILSGCFLLILEHRYWGSKETGMLVKSSRLRRGKCRHPWRKRQTALVQFMKLDTDVDSKKIAGAVTGPAGVVCS